MNDLIVFLVLLTLGYVVGGFNERRHFQSIREREHELANVLSFSERLPPPSMDDRDTVLVSGNVVISIDYFKRLAAGLRNLFGGRVTAYESLIERARREALLRMKEEAQRLGADMVVNVKLETASISKGRKQQIGSVEVLAYGTAMVPVDAY